MPDHLERRPLQLEWMLARAQEENTALRAEVSRLKRELASWVAIVESTVDELTGLLAPPVDSDELARMLTPPDVPPPLAG
jgi:hypothetical protein